MVPVGTTYGEDSEVHVSHRIKLTHFFMSVRRAACAE